jgi:lysophospholipase L1-like esterase
MKLGRVFAPLANRAVYVDLWPALVGPDRALRKDATSDALHLNGNGYQIWVDLLRPHLEPAD